MGDVVGGIEIVEIDASVANGMGEGDRGHHREREGRGDLQDKLGDATVKENRDGVHIKVEVDVVEDGEGRSMR